MKVLGIDTSSYANAIGITGDHRILADFTFEARTDSLEKIVSNIDFTLKSAGLTLSDIQGLGVGLGPGSWTGIRVGVTMGKMLAYSAGKPVCGISTLEALAYNAVNIPAQICSIISAGTKDMVYAAFFRVENNNINRIGEYYVGSIAGLAVMVKEATVIVGPQAKSYSMMINQSLGTSAPDLDAVEGIPQGAVMSLLAERRLECGDSDDVLSMAPLYLKESAARAFLGRYAGDAHMKG